MRRRDGATENPLELVDSQIAGVLALESRARAAALAEKTAKMEKELAARRKSLTDTASQVRAGETTLSKLENERNALADSVDKETEQLNTDKARLAELTAGLVRLGGGGGERGVPAPARGGLALRAGDAGGRSAARGVERHARAGRLNTIRDVSARRARPAR